MSEEHPAGQEATHGLSYAEWRKRMYGEVNRADDPRIAELEKYLSETKARLALSVDCAKSLTAENIRLHNNMNKMSEAIEDVDEELTLLKEENARLREAGEKMAEIMKEIEDVLFMHVFGERDCAQCEAHRLSKQALTEWNEVRK